MKTVRTIDIVREVVGEIEYQKLSKDYNVNEIWDYIYNRYSNCEFWTLDEHDFPDGYTDLSRCIWQMIAYQLQDIMNQ